MSLLDTNTDFTSHRRSFAESLHLDTPLMLALLVLSVTSLFILYSASGQNMDVVYRQSVRIFIAYCFMIGLAQVRPDTLKRWAPWVFTIGIILLFAVLIVGDVGKGAQRWLNLGLFRFQPSEMLKIGVPLMVAWYLSEHTLPPDFRRVFYSSIIVITPMLLIAKQPDLGTALLVGSAGIFALLFAGLRWRLVFIAGSLLAACAPILWYLMRDYQQQRVLTFLNPETDPLGAGYHIIQSKIAIGSGGLYGKGWLNGSQSQLNFLPERATDFVFAAYAEEFGLIGILLLMLIYLFILMRGLLIAAQAQDTFTRLLAGSLVMTFFIYVLVNIGMVTGLLPVVGVPLPLISYGGTSIVTLMASFGILMSIQTHKKLLGKL